jgi:hypothetical protein
MSIESISLESEYSAVVAQTADMSRADIMKKLVGPQFADLMSPVYAEPFSQAETNRIDAPVFNRDLNKFSGTVMRIVTERAESTENYHEVARSIERLTQAKQSLLFHYNFSRLLEEAVTSGVVIPLYTGMQIYKHEAGKIDYYQTLGERFDPDGLVQLMSRPSFDTILHHLTKGPNGFLGGGSLDPTGRTMFCPDFFDFKKENGRPLLACEAFEVKAGAVTSLSDKYHTAANQRRLDIAENTSEIFEDTSHAIADSSGCPVRHRFNDRPSLISLANRFVVAAIEASQCN